MISITIQLAILAALCAASPVAPQKRAAVIPFTSRHSASTRTATGEKVFNKDAALRDRVRLQVKFARAKHHVTKEEIVVKRDSEEHGEEPHDINVSSGKEPLADDYDGIDERKLRESVPVSHANSWGFWQCTMAPSLLEPHLK